MRLLFSFLLFFIILGFSLHGENSSNLPKRILVGSPIRQHPEILKEFLESLDNLNKNTYKLSFCFVDDNDDPVSKKMLEKFSENHSQECILLSPEIPVSSSNYIRTESTHQWTEELIWKVAAFKDRIIQYAKKNDYDYLFLIDSDLVLHPNTLEKLLEGNKGILCNIFWTSWQPGTMEMPQVWLQDTYNFFEKQGNKNKSKEEETQESRDFMAMLRKPGIYEVGGLGACTLIDRNTLLKGVSFKKIKNISFWGEDRHFCVRAAALGIPLYVDTHYPAYHIYRLSAMNGVEAFKEACKKQMEEKKRIRLTLSMIMKDEAGRHLRAVLESAKEYVTDAVIIDDGSKDNSVNLCKEILVGIPLKIITNDISKFSNECSLREQQWNETVKTKPDWILILDADEIFETNFKKNVHDMIANSKADVYLFRLYDFWDSTHYRDDNYWQAHRYYRPFLIRYKPDMTYTFKQTPQHCGRLPLEISNYPNQVLSDLRLKHYGWVRAEDRLEKYERYKLLDPGARYGWKEQYESILDISPHLVEWKE